MLFSKKYDKNYFNAIAPAFLKTCQTVKLASEMRLANGRQAELLAGHLAMHGINGTVGSSPSQDWREPDNQSPMKQDNRDHWTLFSAWQPTSSTERTKIKQFLIYAVNYLCFFISIFIPKGPISDGIVKTIVFSFTLLCSILIPRC